MLARQNDQNMATSKLSSSFLLCEKKMMLTQKSHLIIGRAKEIVFVEVHENSKLVPPKISKFDGSVFFQKKSVSRQYAQ